MTDVEQPKPITHPAWCDPHRCTAPTQPPAKYDPMAYGQHRSVTVIGDWGGSAFLTQAVAPWECTVYLRVEPAASEVSSFPLTPDSPLLLMVRQHVADQQERFPMLVPPLDGGTDRV